MKASASLLVSFVAVPLLSTATPLPSNVAGNRIGMSIAEMVEKEASDAQAVVVSPLTSGAQHLVPGALPSAQPESTLPRVFAPTQPRSIYTRFPWKRNITATVFWIGETPTANNPTPNTVSAWDRQWTANYGGFDDPKSSGREGFIPKNFTPGQNPFYFALPYNDITRTGTKASARAVIPWFKKSFYRSGRTVLKGRWIAIRRGDKVCYAQWEDVGPFQTDDWEYVFGNSRPSNPKNRSAGLDVSPAVRDFLDFGSGYGECDWRFVDIDEVPDGPWKLYGSNNPFATSTFTDAEKRTKSEGIVKVRELRDRLMVSSRNSSNPLLISPSADQ